MTNSTTKKLIMVSSRFGGKEENIKRAEAFCRYVVTRGHIPVAPHVFFPRFLDDLNPAERALGLEGSLALMERCDEVWYFLEDNEDLSNGMKMESELMIKLEMPYKVINASMALDMIDEEKLHESYSQYDVDLSFTPRFLPETENTLKFKNNPPQFDDQDWHLIYKSNCED
jgi:hypothetical protein